MYLTYDDFVIVSFVIIIHGERNDFFLFQKGNGQAIIDESPKNGLEANDVGEAAYAEPLTSEEIRWFYKDGVDKRWVEFCGYDSLRIEKIFQDRQELLSKNDAETNNLPPAEKIVVRGGMYDVEIDNMKCVSIYWPGEYQVSNFILIFGRCCFIYSSIYSLYCYALTDCKYCSNQC